MGFQRDFWKELFVKDTWIKSYRKMVNWQWYTDVSTCHLFQHLVLVANAGDGSWRGMSIKRGQRLTSLGHLALETGLSVQQVRTSLDKLRSTGEITSTATNQYTLITIINYDFYQSKEEKATSEITSTATNEQQTDNKRITTNKNNKNNKKNKNIEREASLPHYEHIKITEDELQKLNDKWGEKITDEYLAKINAYVGSTGRRYKSHYSVVDAWALRDERKPINRGQRERISAEIKKQELEDKRKIDEKYSGDANLSPKLKKIFEEVDV